MKKSLPRLISFYLPQYYPTAENNQWWGNGFTEWTNVGKAKPLFKGHYQPKVPTELGYYDLRLPEIRAQQAALAREAGIEGFCYWHYWFNGKRLLDRVFSEVVSSGSPDFPFCLCWANHSWFQKTWDPDKPDRLLIEQTYPGVDDYVNHFNALLPAFKDKRYITVDGKPVFGIFAPLDIPDVQLFKDTWNQLAKQNGLPGFYFFAYAGCNIDPTNMLNRGFDAIVINYLYSHIQTRNRLYFYLLKIKTNLLKIPHLIHYKDYMRTCLNSYKPADNIHPSISANFDHSPRSASRGLIIVDSTPENWEHMCNNIFDKASCRDHEHNLIFIMAWNEWGEGSYLEPCIKYGRGYINAISNALKRLKDKP